MKRFISSIETFVDEYETGHVNIAGNLTIRVKKIIQQVTYYIMSRYTDLKEDNVDERGVRLPFRNIGNAIVDLEFRAKNIDRKAIEPQAIDGDWIFSLILKKELFQFLKDENFGVSIDKYQRKKSEYGSVLLKKTGPEDDIDIDVVQWSNMIIDPNDIKKGIKIEKYYLLPSEIINKKDVWTEQSEGENGIATLIRKYKAQNILNRRIEVWDIEGEFDDGIFAETDTETYKFYNVIVGVLGNEKIVLHKKEIKESRYKHDKRKEVEGIDWGMGVWQECFEPQIWTNDAVISEKEVMNIAGKVIVATNKKNIPSALTIYNGETIELGAEEFYKPISLAPTTLPEFQNQIDNWFINLQRDQSAYPAVTGEAPKAGTPFSSQALQASQGGSIFNKRRDQDGFFIAEVINDWVFPCLVRKIDKEHKLFASYSTKEKERIDEAIKNRNVTNAFKKRVLAPLSEPSVTKEELDTVASETQEQLDKQGSEREIFIPKGYITMEKINKKVRIDITDEMTDSQRKLNALAVLLQSMTPDDPERSEIIKEMMELSGLSGATFAIGGAVPTPAMAGGGQGQLDRIMKQALPAGQQ